MIVADYKTVIRGHTLEYFDDSHTYLVDGIRLPSITQMLQRKFAKKYIHVSSAVLQSAADKGTAVHDAIYRYCTDGTEDESRELRGFKFLQKQYGFKVIGNEVPVILFLGEPIAAGRLDMVLEMNGQVGGADIKRTAVLDKDYLAYQLNIYRIAYRQSYGINWEFLKGIQLREYVRRFVPIPIAEDLAWEFIDEYFEEKRHE